MNSDQQGSDSSKRDGAAGQGGQTPGRSASDPEAEGVRLLAVGDVHLGRRPGGLPDGVDGALFGPRAALAGVVERALDEQPDAVLFAGDLVEAERDFFEAFGPLADAARRLVEAGIEVLCVCGNHDVHVLPRLVKEVAGVRLLGKGGHWETHTLRRDGAPVARILGWSFPSARVHTSPLRSLDRDLLGDRTQASGLNHIPTIGLLHADLDASNSHYAPVTRAELEAVSGVDAWLLGHIHAPSDFSGSRPVGYLGSLSALDPSAVGRRGPWIAEVGPAGVSMRQLPLSTLRFERVSVDVSQARDQSGLEELLARSVREVGDRVAAEGGEARLVGVRVRLEGRSHLARATRAAVRGQALGGLGHPGENGAFLEEIIDAALPFVDLESLARNADPLGLVARRVLALQAFDEEGRRLVRRALPALRARAEHASFATFLGAATIGEERARQTLLEAGRRTLDELLAQRPDLVGSDLSEAEGVLEPHVARGLPGRAAPRDPSSHRHEEDEPFVFEEDEEANAR